MGIPAIGIVGPFDVEDYGNLLLPYLAEHELGARLGKLDVRRYSPIRRDAGGWPYEVRSVDDLVGELGELEGLVVGGGRLWPAAVLAAASAGLPVVWNSVAASGGTPGWAGPWLREALTVSAYVSVRDERSRDELADVAPGLDVLVTPDPAFGLLRAMSRLDDAPDVDGLLGRLGVRDPFILVQPSGGLEVARPQLEASLPRLAAGGLRLLELAVSPAQGDRCGRLGLDVGLLRVEPWPGPLLLAALVGRARGVIAESLQLSITALAAGVPVHRLAPRPGSAYPPELSLPGIQHFTATGTELADHVLRSTEPDRETIRALEAAVASHWDRMAAALSDDDAGRTARRTAVHRFLVTVPGTLERLAAQRGEIGEQRDHTRQDAERLRRELHAERERAGELAQQVSRAAEELETRRRELSEIRERLRASERALHRLRDLRAVRLALEADRRLRSALRFARRLRRASVPLRATSPAPLPPSRLATPQEEADLTARLRAELPRATVSDGPRVSVIMLHRSGAEHLRLSLSRLMSTAYTNFEVVVVDSGSDAPPLPALEGPGTHFALRVIRSHDSRSFSAGINQGAAASEGELLLLLNQSIAPITPDWLGHMVEVLEAQEAVAVGARLVQARRPRASRAAVSSDDLSLWHRGVGFRVREGMPRWVNLGTGTDPRSPEASAVREVQMLSAACLLVRRDAYEQVGGIGETCGEEAAGVDLCLRLRRAGARLVYDGGAALWHHEFETQGAVGRGDLDGHRQCCYEQFLDRWGSWVYRETLLDRLASARQWSEDPLHIVIATGQDDARASRADALVAHEFGDELRRLGWRVTHAERHQDRWYQLDADVDVLLCLADDYDLTRTPAHVLKAAWVREATQRWVSHPWFDDYDLVLVPDTGAATLIEQRSAKAPHLFPAAEARAQEFRSLLGTWALGDRVDIAVGIPTRGEAERWGDYHFARALQRALERRGRPGRVLVRSEWERPTMARSDVVVHLFGTADLRPRASQVSVLWNISHPDLMTPERCETYDLVLVASQRFADVVRGWGVSRVAALHQATDPARFRPDPTGPAHDLLFVGNSRRVRRRILDDLLPTGRDLAVYGRNWTPDLIDPRHVRGEHIPNGALARYYTSAAIVLNDHWDDMRAEGFLSNRLYDALAAGAFVLSDHVDGIAEEFDGGVVTYRTREELAGLVERFLADPDARREHARRGREAVLARHTFAHRADELWEMLEPLLAAQERLTQAGPLRSSRTEETDQEGRPWRSSGLS